MKNKNEKIKSLIEEMLPILDSEEKVKLIGFLEGMKFKHFLKTHESD